MIFFWKSVHSPYGSSSVTNLIFLVVVARSSSVSSLSLVRRAGCVSGTATAFPVDISFIVSLVVMVIDCDDGTVSDNESRSDGVAVVGDDDN